MVSQSLQDLTGTSDDKSAWDALFRHFNKTHNRGDVGYQVGETIAIKINMNACGSYNVSPTSFYSSPQTILSMLTQLVENAGVNPADITFYDATRYIPQTIYDKCKAAYPDVVLADWDGGKGRQKIQRDTNAQIKFSQKLDLEPDGGNPTYVPKQVSQAQYHINMAQLKGHNLAGITLGGKNQFGSIMSYPPDNNPQNSAPKNAGLHPYVCVHDDFHNPGTHWDFDKRDMKTYNSIVDLMGYEHLGAKTMLFFVDGLYSAPDQSTALKASHKWKSFNNDWPNSIFVSQDFVAIESVCLDFLRDEATQTNCKGNVDNYLHEAALAHNAPSGTVYDPEQDGTPLKSLGVHEHWNNATDKKYTRNLGTGEGIELLIAGSGTAVHNDVDVVPEVFAVNNYPNPFNAQTRISFTLPNNSDVHLDVFNIRGERVTTLINQHYQAGTHNVAWNGTDDDGQIMPSGFYLLRLKAGHQTMVHKVALAK
jgi:hypothetical protein